MKKILAGGIVIGPGNKILIVNQHNDSWSLPKGYVEDGESKLGAAKREIYEESGVVIDSLKLIKELGSYERCRIGKGGIGEVEGDIREITFFLFTTKQIKLSPIDKENPEAHWVEKGEVVKYLTHPKDREFFESIKNQLP